MPDPPVRWRRASVPVLVMPWNMSHVAQQQAFLRTVDDQADVTADPQCLSRALSSLWKLIPDWAGFICRSKAVVLATFCSSPLRRARLSVKVSAMRKFMSSSHSSDWTYARHSVHNLRNDRLLSNACCRSISDANAG